MVDGCLVNMGSSADILASSVFGSEPDLKLTTSGVDFANVNSNGFQKEDSGSPLMTTQRQAHEGGGPLQCKYPQSPVYAGNSLIRQLLQASPQYSHLLGDLAAPLNGFMGTTKTSALSGSPKLQHATRDVNVRSHQQTTVVVKKTGSSSSSSTGTPQLSRFHASNCRIINGYVNIGGDDVTSDEFSVPLSSSAAAVVTSSSSSPATPLVIGKTTIRDRSARPSTAPADHSQQHQQQQFSSSASASLQEQSPSDRRRSCEALDRTVSNGSEPASSAHIIDCLLSGRGIVSVGTNSPTSAQRMHPICSPHCDQTSVSNSRPTASPELRSSPRQADCSQQRLSPQLRESPQQLQQQRQSPSQLLQRQYDEPSNATVSCPLQSTGDSQHISQQTVW
jgi:hypothetical protein